MAKGGKLTKLTSILKKLSSFGKQSESSSSGRSNRSLTRHSSSEESESNDGHGHQHAHVVYVGKSRRRYVINNEVMEHPLFQELVVGCEDGDELFVVGCEVVMFEHLLWMIDNADPQPELVDFYAC